MFHCMAKIRPEHRWSSNGGLASSNLGRPGNQTFLPALSFTGLVSPRLTVLPSQAGAVQSWRAPWTAEHLVLD